MPSNQCFYVLCGTPLRLLGALTLGNSREKTDKIYYETLRVGVKRGCFEYGVVE
jgi:hypothetical protein